MRSYALDIWHMSWITAASKAQRGLLAVPEDTSLRKERVERGGVFIKFSSYWQAACFSLILYFDLTKAPPVSHPQPPLADTHALPLCWLVSKVITGRLLHAFMKYSNGSMSYCALIMPHKDKGDLGDRWADIRKRTVFAEKKNTPFRSNIGGILTAQKTHLSWKCLCLLAMPHCRAILISVLKRELPVWWRQIRGRKNRNQSK